MSNKRDIGYIESGRWRCPKSPTGAHFWLEAPSMTKVNSGNFYCKWCLDVKKMPIHFEEALRVSGIKAIPVARVSEVYIRDLVRIRQRREL